MSTPARLNIHRLTMGDAVPALNTVVQQLGDLLTDTAPGGLLDIRTQADNIIGQVQTQIDTLKAEKGALESQVGSLTLQLQALTGAMAATGVASVEFSGSFDLVLGAVSSRASEIAPNGAAVYGVMLVASTPEANLALSSILGAARTLTLP
jgi:hypothetical protein